MTRLRALKLNWTSISSISAKIRNLKNLRFLELSETPFFEILYSLRDDKAETKEEKAVSKISDILSKMKCEIEG